MNDNGSMDIDPVTVLPIVDGNQRLFYRDVVTRSMLKLGLLALVTRRLIEYRKYDTTIRFD